MCAANNLYVHEPKGTCPPELAVVLQIRPTVDCRATANICRSEQPHFPNTFHSDTPAMRQLPAANSAERPVIKPLYDLCKQKVVEGRCCSLISVMRSPRTIPASSAGDSAMAASTSHPPSTCLPTWTPVPVDWAARYSLSAGWGCRMALLYCTLQHRIEPRCSFMSHAFVCTEPA